VTRDSGRKLALLCVATLTILAPTIIAPALPRVVEAFRGVAHVELLAKLMLTLPALFIAVGAPLAGAIVDRFGRLTLLRGCLVLYGLAGAAGYVLTDLYAILASRMLLGVAIAGSMTTLTALVGDYFHGEERARFAGMQSTAMSLGAMVFVGVGGLLADVSWRLVFLVYLAGWLVVIPTVLYLHEPAHRHGAGDKGADAAPVAWRRVAAAYAITFFALVVFYMTPVQVPFLVRDLGVRSSAAAGFVIVLSSLAAAAGAQLYARASRGNGVFAIYGWAFGLIAAGYALIGFASSYAVVLAGALVSGLGVGLFFPNSYLWLLSLAPERLRGRLSGGMTTAVFLGQFFSPLLAQPVIDAVSLPWAFVITASLTAVVAATLGSLRRLA
jgi:MFS family permease